jgi:hypothetical protein
MISDDLQPWWAADLDSIQRGVPSSDCSADHLQPQACTLLMGGLNDVLAAQLANLNNLAGHGVGEGRDVWTQTRGSRGVLCFQQCLARDDSWRKCFWASA